MCANVCLLKYDGYGHIILLIIIEELNIENVIKKTKNRKLTRILARNSFIKNLPIG